MPTTTRPVTAADMHAATQQEKSTHVCVEAAQMLKKAKGRRRILLSDLGPAQFNRFGCPLSGKQILGLAERILVKEGFAKYRYVAGWCHEPDPGNDLDIYHHAVDLARTDPVLPHYSKKPLYGCFRKNHLVAMLQLIQEGRETLPGYGAFISSQSSPAWDELNDVLNFGIEMEVFAYGDVAANLGAFESLMASDNVDSAFALAEDEFGMMTRLFQLHLRHVHDDEAALEPRGVPGPPDGR